MCWQLTTLVPEEALEIASSTGLVPRPPQTKPKAAINVWGGLGTRLALELSGGDRLREECRLNHWH